MSKIRCIVIEDEPLAAKILYDYVSQVPFLEFQKHFKDAIAAAVYLREHETDLIFLDIHLPKIKGISFLRSLPDPPAVIITTAYHQYAVEGFNLNVTDYLLKPFDFNRFLTAVKKVKTALGQKESSKDQGYLVLSVKKRKAKIFFTEILYVESQKEYVKIVTQERTYISKIPTHKIESLLPPLLFRRIHRSFIVSIQRIRTFSAESVEIMGISIPIGRGYKDVIKHF